MSRHSVERVAVDDRHNPDLKARAHERTNLRRDGDARRKRAERDDGDDYTDRREEPTMGYQVASRRIRDARSVRERILQRLPVIGINLQ